jgi:hypothetical protein
MPVIPVEHEYITPTSDEPYRQKWLDQVTRALRRAGIA